jgi:hypothetical protein
MGKPDQPLRPFGERRSPTVAYLLNQTKTTNINAVCGINIAKLSVVFLSVAFPSIFK